MVEIHKLSFIDYKIKPKRNKKIFEGNSLLIPSTDHTRALRCELDKRILLLIRAYR
jgi:hypothetical protein